MCIRDSCSSGSALTSSHVTRSLSGSGRERPPLKNAVLRLQVEVDRVYRAVRVVELGSAVELLEASREFCAQALCVLELQAVVALISYE